MSLKVLDAPATAAALPWTGLIDALRDMLDRRRAGLTCSPERLAVPLSGGVLLAMPATDGEYASTKLVTVCAGNASRGLPTLLGEVLLMRADTGERLLMLDGPTVTARRTAAMSVLAAIELAPARFASIDDGRAGEASPDGERPAGRPKDLSMLIVGSGVQAQAHLEAFTRMLGVNRIRVASRTTENARAFAARAMAAGLDCEAVQEPERYLRKADIVVTATTSLAPLFDDDPGFGGFVAAVGAFRPEMCELPSALLARSRLYIDDKPGGLHEAGDFIQAKIDWARVTALEDHLAAVGREPDRPREDELAGANATPGHSGAGEACAGTPVVFKSVGQALWDLAACRLAAERLGAGA